MLLLGTGLFGLAGAVRRRDEEVAVSKATSFCPLPRPPAPSRRRGFFISAVHARLVYCSPAPLQRNRG